MSRSKHTKALMIAALMQMEAGRRAEDVAREVWNATTPRIVREHLLH